MLIFLARLPGTGKTTLAREIARQSGALHIRIDSIEQAIRDCRLDGELLGQAGYRIGYVLAEDNLRAGRMVVVDAVNPVAEARDAWLAVARRAQATALECEIVCSDTQEHRRRVETRISDIAGLRLPTWQDVLERDYQSWTREHLVIDTAVMSIAAAAKLLSNAIEARIRSLDSKA